MKERDFKYIKSKCQPDKPADIFFYTDVDSWSVNDFLYEFNYLVDYVGPSVIRVHINSVGGNVVDGMSVFNRIMDCPIATQTINDSLAASMGSVIWAAGKELYMKDYALLMIHNPFCESSCDSPETKQMITAFTQQLKTLYSKRFGLCESDVEAIMNGKEGEDGTFLTAQEAVEKGFVKAENVLATPQVMKDKIRAALNGTKDIGQIKAVYSLIDEQFTTSKSIENNKNTISKTKKMENETTVFAALFGLTGDKANAENVTAKINEMKAKAEKADALQKNLDEAKAELVKVQAELTGANTSVKNLTTDLESAKAALKVYQDAEAAAQAQKVNDLIEKAIKNCQINKDEKDLYVKMAQDNYDLAVNVLAKIPARDNLGNVIATANAGEAQRNIKTEEEQLKAKVDEIVGKDFKFRTIE